MVAAGGLVQAHEAERLQRLRVAAELERLGRLDLGGSRSERECQLADQHLARGGGFLEPLGDCDRHTRDGPVAARDDLAALDADAGLQTVRGERVADLDRGPQCAQCIILVHRGHPEHRQQPVCAGPLDRAAVPGDRGSHQLQRMLEHPPQCFRVGRLVGSDVGEHHRHHLAGLDPDRRCQTHRAAVARRRYRCRCGCRQVECRVMAKDLPLELLQRLTRLEPEPLDEFDSAVLVHLERIRLPT